MNRDEVISGILKACGYSVPPKLPLEALVLLQKYSAQEYEEGYQDGLYERDV